MGAFTHAKLSVFYISLCTDPHGLTYGHESWTRPKSQVQTAEMGFM